MIQLLREPSTLLFYPSSVLLVALTQALLGQAGQL
jgi:hypothetical protein